MVGSPILVVSRKGNPYRLGLCRCCSVSPSGAGLSGRYRMCEVRLKAGVYPEPVGAFGGRAIILRYGPGADRSGVQESYQP